MSAQKKMHFVLAILVMCSGVLLASGSRSGKALWIEVREKGERKTTIAMTEGIAKQLLESKELKVNFSEKGKKELITMEMLRAVLDGREESVEARDSQDGSEAKVYMKRMNIPGN